MDIFCHGCFFSGMLERAHAAGQAEVADLEFAIGIEEQIAWFAVLMDGMGGGHVLSLMSLTSAMSTKQRQLFKPHDN